MSDRMKDLFDPEGFTVTPLPPSEVRRQGDRQRRRRNVAGVVASVAAVALIATPIALIAGGDDSASPDPAPPTGDWVTTIPDDFPLTVLLPEKTEDDGFGAEMEEGPGPGHLNVTPCGKQGFNYADAADVAAYRQGAEFADLVEIRTLAVYASDTGAIKALDDTAAGLAECPDQPTTDGEPLYQVQDIPVGEQSVVYTQRATEAGELVAGTQVTGLVRVGNAVVVVSSADGTLPVNRVDVLVAELVHSLNVLAGEMCIFAAEPCAGGSGQQVDDGPSDIPAGFPLDLRQRAMVGDGGVDLAPSEDVEGIAWEQLCGGPIWTMDYLHRIGSMGTGPEFSDIRELRTYVSTDEAAIQMESFRELIHGCPTYGNQVLTVHSADTGHETLTWSITYTDGLGSSLYQATRVGRAVLMTVVSGEGSIDSVASGIPEATSLSEDIAAEMCVFTEDGCGSAGSTSLSEADLIAAEETQPRYESAWEIVETYQGEGSEPASPCFGNTFTGRNATTVFRRDFEMVGPQGPIEGDSMTAVVAEFPDRLAAQAAYIGFGEDAGLCEAQIVPGIAAEYTPAEGGELQLENVDGLARTWFATYGPYPGASDAVYRLETGVAWVGKRVVVMTTMSGPFEPGKPSGTTAMEAMLVQAAERLLPGPEGPITAPPIMP